MRGEKVDILKDIIGVKFSNNVKRSVRECDIVGFREAPRGDIHDLKDFDAGVIKAMGSEERI